MLDASVSRKPNETYDGMNHATALSFSFKLVRSFAFTFPFGPRSYSIRLSTAHCGRVSRPPDTTRPDYGRVALIRYSSVLSRHLCGIAGARPSATQPSWLRPGMSFDDLGSAVVVASDQNSILPLGLGVAR
jgi:hypothetical protein